MGKTQRQSLIETHCTEQKIDFWTKKKKLNPLGWLLWNEMELSAVQIVMEIKYIYIYIFLFFPLKYLNLGVLMEF